MGIFRRRKRATQHEHGGLPEREQSDPAPAATAQQVFATMMKDTVAPALRQLGFTGSGQVFSLPSPNHFARIGFQKSTYSTSDQVRVTANISVIPVAVWERERADSPALPRTPAPSVFYGAFAWQKRIGDLLPSGEDTWWIIDRRTDPQTVAADIVESIRDHALPAMRRQLDES
jgi:hypothetical protein